MNKLLDWIKENKLASILLVVVLLFILRFLSTSYLFNRVTRLGNKQIQSTDLALPESGGSREIGIPSPVYDSTPQPDVEDRMIVKNSNVSIVVNDVDEVINRITTYATDIGGYMVNSSVREPEGLSKGTLSIRVPTDRLEETLSFLDEQAVKVVSKEVIGEDVTDEYIDIEERIETLENSKTKYEELFNTTNDTEQILQITDKIINLEQRIDNLKGRQNYLEETSKTSLIRINLATTELELPYNPENPWRPKVVFKYAVRSLVGLARGLASLAIWTGVYSILWAPIVAYIIFRRKKNKK